MDHKELAEMCRYLSDTPSYTAFHDEVEREVICDSCKGGLCYEKVQDAHWCMYEALQRAATAITDLLARAEAAEKRVEELEKSLSDAAQVVKTMQESTIPFYRRRAEAAESRCETMKKVAKEYQEELIPGYRDRAEKAERERDEYFKHLQGFCFCCAHRTDGFDCKAKCYGHKRGSAWVYAGPKKED